MIFYARLPAWTRAITLLAIGFGISGCSSFIDLEGSGPDVGVRPTAVAGLALSETGLGRVDQSTPFSARALSEALDGARVETVSATYQGRVTTQLAAFGPSGLQMARFEGDGGRINRIQVVSEEVPGPGGVRVGMTYAQSYGNSLDCREGGGNWTGMAVCERSGSAVTYVYSVPFWQGGSMPRGNDLNEAVLNRMIWEP